MLRKIHLISTRYYSCEKIKKMESPLQRSPKLLFNKLFLSHLYIEKDSKWILKDKNEPQYVVHHPSLKYSVSILKESDMSIGDNVYAIALNPMKHWLVRERNKVMLFTNSKVASNLLKMIEEQKGNILELCVNANFLSEFLFNVRPTGSIINVFNLNTPPILAGELKSDIEQTVFIPSHRGFPILSIPTKGKISFMNDKDIFCEMISWDHGSKPIGRLLDGCPINFKPNAFHNSTEESPILNLGLEEEIKKLLNVFMLKDEPFSKEIMSTLAKDLNDLKVGKKELKKRESFIDRCVISIDPIDAKDLDDALHIATRPDGNFEVGVHIADVSHFLRPDTPADKEAAVRSSSTYLMHKVIPMLPEILSEELCSLNPGDVKLTFSVVFVVNSLGTIISERFVKSVIQPKMRLNYDEATEIIEGDIESLPGRIHPDFKEVVKSVKKLDEIAKALRENRIKNGAFVLNKVEIKFSLDEKDSGDEDDTETVSMPSSFRLKKIGSSNYLIEEWMLLANQAAARLLYNHMISSPTARANIGAVLRRHGPPDSRQNYDLINSSKAAGITLGQMNTGKLQQQITNLKTSSPLKSLSLSYLCYFNMQLAVYYCAENFLQDQNKNNTATLSPFHHYGLNVPLYTHFTSPIRRYADVLVHRQIDAIISGKPSSGLSLTDRAKAVNAANLVRPANRRIHERLQSLYMAAYLNRKGWKLSTAVILREQANKLTLLLPLSGLVLRTDLLQFAPWAFAVSKHQTNKHLPVSYRLKYSVLDSKYEIISRNGFVQYVYKWPQDTSSNGVEEQKEEKEEKDGFYEQLEERIGELSERKGVEGEKGEVKEEKEEGKEEKEEVNYSMMDISVFELIDVVLCCSSDKLELVCQMPFPGLMAQLKQDPSRQL